MSLNPISFTGVTAGGLTVKELDGNPNVPNVTTIQVSNGTLTNNGGGIVTISTGGGGGGSGTVTSITAAADSGTGTAITTSGTFTFTGGAGIDTSVSGTTVTFASKVRGSGRFATSVAGGGAGITSVVVSDSAVTATNDIIFSLEASGIQVTQFWVITSRNAGNSFTVEGEAINPTPGALDFIINYIIADF
jgi:hypothetical protein